MLQLPPYIGAALQRPWYCCTRKVFRLSSGDRRPGTVGVPLPGITVKVAPLPEESDQDKQNSAEFVDGMYFTSTMGRC